MAKKDQDTVDKNGERRDAELFEEENQVDGAWIPLGFAWNSPAEVRARAEEIEESAAKAEKSRE